MTDQKAIRYKGRMAKHIVKAARTGTQIRITIPGMLLKEMKWEKSSYFVLKKTSNTTVEIIKLFEMEDNEWKKN